MSGFFSMLESALEGLDENAEKIATKVREGDGGRHARARPAADLAEDDEEDKELAWARENLERRKRGEAPLPPPTPPVEPAAAAMPPAPSSRGASPAPAASPPAAAAPPPAAPGNETPEAAAGDAAAPEPAVTTEAPNATPPEPSLVAAAAAALPPPPALPSLPKPPALPVLHSPPSAAVGAGVEDAPDADADVGGNAGAAAQPARDDAPEEPMVASGEAEGVADTAADEAGGSDNQRERVVEGAAPASEGAAAAAVRLASPPTAAAADDTATAAAAAADSRVELLEEEIMLINREKAALAKKIKKMEALREEVAERTHEQVKTLTAAKEVVEEELREASINARKATRDIQGKYDKAVEQMKAKDEHIQELQSAKDARYERDAKDTERLRALQSENDDLQAQSKLHAEEITEMQQKISTLESDLAELHREMDAKDDDIRAGHSMIQMKESVNRSISLELEQYKARVARIVIEKDQEVAELTDRLANASSIHDGASFQHDASLLGGLGAGGSVEEHPAYQEALTRAEQLQNSLHTLQQEKRMLEAEADAGEVKYRQELTELNSIVEHYKTTAEQLQASLSAAQQQAVDAQHAIVQQRGDFEKDVRAKDLQLQQVEKKLQKRDSEESKSELNVRCQRLGEALMEKQAALETRNAELEQSRLRLTSALQQIREMELLTSSSSKGGVGVTRHNDVEAQDHHEPTPYRVHNSRFFQKLSRHSAAGRAVVDAAAQVDHAALQAGRFLRRNALLRVMLVLYIALLHLYFFIFMGIAAPDHPLEAHPTGADSADGSGSR